MGYIKELYAKKPILVKSWMRKVFNVTEQYRIFDIKPMDECVEQNCVLLGLISLKTRDVTEILLEDFAIWHGDECIEIDDKRLQYYLIQMAKNCDDKYIQGFHNFKTYNMESKMAKAISDLNKKEVNKTL